MPRKKADARENSVSLHIGSSFPAAWQAVLQPWFEKTALVALASATPPTVIVPARGYADFLRRQLLGCGLSLLGVRFFTPAQLREFLFRRSSIRLPLREHLRLLLAMSAAELDAENEANSVESAIAKSIARNPDNFLRALDQISAAGCKPNQMEPPLLGEIATDFEKRVHECGFTLVHEADRTLVHSKGNEPPEFGDLLVVGFNGAHWPLWPLLRGAVRRCEAATVVLSDPRDQARGLDEAWVGTWEQYLDEAKQISAAADEQAPFSELTQPLESIAAVADRKKNPLPRVQFLIGRDSYEQARAIATLAFAFLNDQSCETVAVLLPGPGALARLVAHALETMGVPHNDSIAHNMRGTFDDEEWRAWLDLQQRPQVGPLLRFLAQSPAALEFFPKLHLREIERTIRRACGDVLINEIEVIADYCERHENANLFATIADGLHMIRLLPQRANFQDFLETTSSIFRELRWGEQAAELERLSRGWCAGVKGDLARPDFLRWLTELFSESALSRDPQGNQPYARIQLVRYDQAENQSWSHLILGGLNEGEWPKRDDESPFLGDEQISALNTQQRELNRRATKVGRFGAGQTVVREGATLCLGARERRDLALRQLLNAIESTTGEIGIAAQLYNTSPREQAVNPSEFFARLYFNARGVALSQGETERIHARTVDWLTRAVQTKKPSVRVDQTLIAYQARRRPEQPSGEYEFAFPKDLPPRQPVSLSATDAAKIFTAPALSWIKNFLGVKSDEGDVVSWNLATGQWVHRWLASVSAAANEKRFVAKPAANEITERVDESANNFLADIRAILAATKRSLPDWWLSGWRNAHYLARRFAGELGRVPNWNQLATEWQLDSPETISLDDRHKLLVRGRVDLILARADGTDVRELWIVDYKTGLAAALKSKPNALRKQLAEGNGVQVCIYALALRRFEASEIYVSLLTRETDLTGPQLNLADVTAQDGIWKEIAQMEANGIFGMLGEIRSAYRFTGVYPLATLAIDKDFLRDKWRRTHPAFAGIEVESDE